MAKLNISQAAKEWGIARSTIQRKIRSGELSATTGDGASKVIDISEMLRVFGEPRGVAIQQQSDSMKQQKYAAHEALVQQLRTENDFLRRQVEQLNSDLREIRRPILPRLLPWMKE